MSELLSKLQAAGTIEAKGGFTIDPEKAREKLRQYQLADPHRYVLLLVEAAVSSGATKLEFEIDADDVHLRFGGSVFAYEQLENIYASLFAQGEQLEDLQAADLVRLRGLQQLAFALNSAMALNPSFARVESIAEDGSGTALVLYPSSRDEVARVQGMTPGNHIHVRDRWRPGLVVEFVRKLRGSLAELVLLREHCLWSRTPVVINGVQISQAMRFVGEPWSEIEVVDGQRMIGRAALGLREPKIDGNGELVTPSVQLLSNGVYIESCELSERAVAGFVAIVDSPRFGKDVSQTKLVHDDGYDAVIDAVVEAQDRLIRRLAEAQLGERAPSWAGSILIDWIELRLPPRLRRNTLRKLLDDEVFAAVAEVPLWPVIGAAPISTRTLFETDGPIRFAWAEFEFAPVDVPFVLREQSSRQRALLERLFGDRLLDYTTTLQREHERQHKRLEFMTRTQLPELGPGYYLVRESIRAELRDGGSIRGELGLRPLTQQHGWVRLVTEGCLLAERAIDGPLPGLCAVVSAPFAPNHDYDAAQPDAVVAAAMIAMLEALDRALTALAESGALDSPALTELRGLLRIYVQQSCRSEYVLELLEQLGFDRKQARRTLDSLGIDLRPSWRLDGPPEQAHPIARVPLYAQAHGQPRSLVQLAARRRGEGGTARRLPWLEPDGSALPQLDTEVLLLGAEDREALRTLLGSDALEPFADKLGWLRRREAFLARSPTQPEHQHATLVGVDFTAERPCALRGQLGLREYAFTAVTDGRTPVRVYYCGRELCELSIELPLPGLCAWIDSEALELGPNFDAVAHPMSLRRPLLGALVELCSKQLDRLGTSELLRCEWWFVAMLPTVVLGGAELAAMLVTLRSKLELDACMAELAGLTELLSRYPGRDLDRAVGWLRGRGQPPRAELIADRLGRPTRRLIESEQDLAWLRQALVPTLVRLMSVPLFRRLDASSPAARARSVTLDHLFVHVASGSPISWVGEDFHLETLPQVELEILVLDPIEQRMLDALFGSAALELVSDWLIGRAQFERRKTISEVRVARGSALVVLPIDSRGVRGELGLARLPPGESTRSKVRVFCEAREITSLDLPARPLALIGALEFETLELNDAHDDLTPSARGMVQQFVFDQTDALITELAERYAKLDKRDRPRAAEIVRYLLNTWPPGTGGYAARANNRRHVFARLAELPVFPGARKPWSAVELAEARKRGPIAAIDYRRPGAELPDLPVVVLETAEIGATLQALFGGLRDFDEELRAQRELEARRAKAPDLPDGPRTPALASTELDAEGLRGRLWLARDEDQVCLGDGGKQITRQRISPLYQVAGAVWGPGLAIDSSWTRVTLTRAQVRVLERFGCELWGMVIDEFVQRSEVEAPRDAAERERFVSLRDAIHQLFLRLHEQYGGGRSKRRKSGRKQGNRHEQLLARLWKLPVLQLSNDRWISPEVAERERPIELTELKLWSGPSAEELAHQRAVERREAERRRERELAEERERARQAARRRSEEQARQREAERRRLAEAEARRRAERDAMLAQREAKPSRKPKPEPKREVEPEVESKREVEPEQPTVEATPLPEQLLLEALREELRLVRADNAGLVSNRRLDAIDLGEPVRRGPLFRHADGRVEIDTGHPVFVAALDGYLDDPGLLTLLASAAYTYLNIIHLDIEDTHEAEFIRRHAAYASTRMGS